MAKLVTLAAPTDDFDPKSWIEEIIGQAPAQNSAGNTISVWAKRHRILEAMREGDNRSFVLEDEDYNHMKDVIESFSNFPGGPKGRNIPHYLKMREDINNAKKPPKPEQKDTANGN